MQVTLDLCAQGKPVLRRPVDRAIFSVGRNPECDLCIPDDAVAPVQLLLCQETGVLILKNRSAEGTRVGDEIVTDALRLAAGDRISLGPLDADLLLSHPEAPPRRSGVTRTLAEKPQKTKPVCFLTVGGTDAARRWCIDECGIKVGSDLSNDIVLDDPYVSSFHASLWMDDGRCMVRDLDSRNGLWVAGNKTREGEVPAGSQVQMGKSVLWVHAQREKTDARKDPLAPGGPLVGGSEPMERLRDLIRRVAAVAAPVLITGESGTGKEVVARIVGELSPTAGGPFVPLNCGALSRSLCESELFGHERGAFTGAVARKAGAFEAAHGGVLFLDEIGDLPLELQPQLLRVLEAGEVRRIGSNTPFHVQVRLIAATNKCLGYEAAVGHFREDLMHRLQVLVLEIPPLRDRIEDIPDLTRHFLDQFAPTGEGLDIADDAIDKLVAYDWPGNVRELRNVLEQASVLRTSFRIEASHIIFRQSTLRSRVQSSAALMAKTAQQIERDTILVELTRHRGDLKATADALGVLLPALRHMIVEYGIDLEALLVR